MQCNVLYSAVQRNDGGLLLGARKDDGRRGLLCDGAAVGWHVRWDGAPRAVAAAANGPAWTPFGLGGAWRREFVQSATPNQRVFRAQTSQNE